MRLRRNRSLIEALVLGMRRSDDGLGADLDLEVRHCEAMQPDPDFIGAAPGHRITAYVAVPEAVSVGHCLRFEATVLGGPDGERIVLSRPRELSGPVKPDSPR